jgi:hypothetical protein
LSDERLTVLGYPSGVVEAIGSDHAPRLYPNQQLRDALTTFVSLLVVLRKSGDLVCVNRPGTSPLEHAFGRGRIRARDVHTMKKLSHSFASDSLSLVVDTFLELTAEPRRSTSVGLDGEPFTMAEPSVFALPAKVIPISLLLRTRLKMRHLPVEQESTILQAYTTLNKIANFTGRTGY